MELTEYGKSLFPKYELENSFHLGQWEIVIVDRIGNDRTVLAVRAQEVLALLEMGIIKRIFPV